MHAALIERIIVAVGRMQQHCQTTSELQRIWQRLDKGNRLVKEMNECIPVVACVVDRIHEASTEDEDNWTVVDLCSGVGYVSIVLAAILDPKKVKRIVLVDKQWPLIGGDTLDHHINPDHIHKIPYPIEVDYRKYDLKASSGQRAFKQHIVDRVPGPLLLLGVHLCGTLSLRAIEIFNSYSQCLFLALKPCCLPVEHGTTQKNRPSKKGRKRTIWKLGGAELTSEEVAGEGKYVKGKWVGPPKSELEPKFDNWAAGLLRSIYIGGTDGHKEILDIQVGSPQRQEETGHHYQTKFIFAAKPVGIVSPAEMALETVELELEPPDKDATKAAAKARREARVRARRVAEGAVVVGIEPQEVSPEGEGLTKSGRGPAGSCV